MLIIVKKYSILSEIVKVMEKCNRGELMFICLSNWMCLQKWKRAIVTEELGISESSKEEWKNSAQKIAW